MSAPFERTFRSLHADRWPRWEHALLAALTVLVVWLGWALLARVSVRVLSREAQLQARDASFELVAEVDGRVVEVLARAGDPVVAGQLILRLDDSAARLDHAAADAEREALILRLANVDDQIVQQKGRIEALMASRKAGQEEAGALARSGAAVAERDAQDARAAEALVARGAMSTRDEAQARAGATSSTEQSAALRSAARRQDREAEGALSGARAELSALLAEQARLEGELTAAEARLQAQLDRLLRFELRAPADGTLASLVELLPGARVVVGQPLGSVVSASPLFIVANLDPGESLGRVQVGQSAQMTLDGFPRVAFGALPARVERVAAEPRDGRLRVELTPLDPVPAGLTLRHGMSGAVEVEVEQVSPAALLLRASGKALGEARP